MSTVSTTLSLKLSLARSKNCHFETASSNGLWKSKILKLLHRHTQQSPHLQSINLTTFRIELDPRIVLQRIIVFVGQRQFHIGAVFAVEERVDRYDYTERFAGCDCYLLHTILDYGWIIHWLWFYIFSGSDRSTGRRNG